jgi:hypothetical protein
MKMVLWNGDAESTLYDFVTRKCKEEWWLGSDAAAPDIAQQLQLAKAAAKKAAAAQSNAETNNASSPTKRRKTGSGPLKETPCYGRFKELFLSLPIWGEDHAKNIDKKEQMKIAFAPYTSLARKRDNTPRDADIDTAITTPKADVADDVRQRAVVALQQQLLQHNNDGGEISNFADQEQGHSDTDKNEQQQQQQQEEQQQEQQQRQQQ